MEGLNGFRRKYETRVLPLYNQGCFGEFAGVGGIRIRYVVLEKENSRGALILLPGKSETYLKYAEFLHDLHDLPLSLYAMDHRGMGFSQRMLPDRLKTHVQRFEHYVEDARSFVESVVAADERSCCFVVGHSTGALIAALLLANHPGIFRAGVLCSPLFELPLRPLPGFLAAALARVLEIALGGRRYGPGQKDLIRPGFEDNNISHDQDRWSLWEREIIPTTREIRFGGVTRRWLAESLRAGQQALRRAAEIEVPLLLLQAGADRIVSRAAQDRFCRRAPRCTCVQIPGAHHEIFIEQDSMREAAIARLKDFLSDQLQDPALPKP